MAIFNPVDNDLDFPKAEEEILAFWREHKIFSQQLALNSSQVCRQQGREHKPFVFFEGPPTANGMPHPGHVLTRVIKDIFLRYKAVQGFDVPRKAGWDTHGLPVEIEVEKNLGIEGKEGIEAFGVEAFVKQCKNSVFTYSEAWRKLTERIGFWVDLDDPYVTYHQSYIESVWWILKKFWDAGLLFHGHKVVPYCPRCGTALSSHEVGQGYKEVGDPSLYVTFPVKGKPGLSLLAWTTTPWTLLSNVALAVGVKHEYDYVEVNGETLIVASALRAACLGKIEHHVSKTVKGSDLLGIEYDPLFSFARIDKPAFRVVSADFVGLDTGSGIVHIAPAFGEDDYRIGHENDLPVINLVKPDGTFTDEVTPWKGIFVKEADREIIKALKERRLVLKSEQYLHDYPFCWRCDSPLIYYARPTWYINTTSVKEEMLTNNQNIDWHPEHIKQGRFGNFLESNIDWALSRERYWGTPLPIWQCQGCSHQTAIGSLKELREQACHDCGEVELHKPYVDEVFLNCPKCSSRMKRVPEVIDCWFDSGAMPLAQWGYPHGQGSSEKLDELYPAAFITEAIDQTRGWFYSLLAIATLLRECALRQQTKQKSGQLKPGEHDPFLDRFGKLDFPLPYKRCLVLGHVCDQNGQKMSKSKGNYLDPWEILNENGADAMRWHFYSSNHPWVSVRFSKASIRDAQKDFLVRLRNVCQFFTIYANIDDFSPVRGLKEIKELSLDSFTPAESFVFLKDRCRLDRWIRSKLANTILAVNQSLEAMDIHTACKSLHDFVDALSNWYVRRSRNRFWKPEKDTDKYGAYWTLYECLTQCSLLLTPFVPFFAEKMYQDLARHLLPALPVSVHLHPWPKASPLDYAPELEHQMAVVREVASLGLSARASQKIKVRQPLGEAIVILASQSDRQLVMELQDVICEELNVKSLVFTDRATTYVKYEIKANFKLLGPRLGKEMGTLSKVLNTLDASVISSEVNQGKSIQFPFGDGLLTLTPEEIDVRISAREGYVAAQGPKAVVVLDTAITEELAQECLAREVISRIQGMRKELDLAFERRILVEIDCTEKVRAAILLHAEFIKSETLTSALQFGRGKLTLTESTEIENEALTISIGMDTVK